MKIHPIAEKCVFPRFNDSRLRLLLLLRDPWSDSDQGSIRNFGIPEADREQFLSWLSSVFRYVEGKETTAQAALAHVASVLTGAKEEDMMSEDPARLASLILRVHAARQAGTCLDAGSKCSIVGSKVGS